MVTLKPRCLSSNPREEAVIPLPNDETTPPVMKINFTFLPRAIKFFFVLKYRAVQSDNQF
jgi:hypothetical protein